MATAGEASSEPRGPGRPRQFDLDDALDMAIAVFSERGYHGTSLTTLAAAMSVSEGSLYKAFRDKRAIFLAAFERYQILRNERLGKELAAAPSGRDKVRTILTVYAEHSHGGIGKRGCLVVGSAVELSTADPDMAQRVTRVLDAHEKRLADLIGLGQQDGSIAGHVDATVAARLLLCVVQGMRVIGKTGRTREEMTSLVDGALKLLD